MEARRRIYEVITSFPGLHFREIQRRTRLGNGSLKYNLGVLERRGVIESERHGRMRRYYPRGMARDERKLLALLHLGTVRRILIFLLAHPGARHGEITRVLRLSPSTVSWHLRKLVEHGVVRESRGGYLLADSEALRRTLEVHRSTLAEVLEPPGALRESMGR
ncbi:MAG: winged helix-turn-helix transcriptional regulator [Euryarchaeota archaeon]|nr:winged helix-turn-helix transcriptional regulator [Euryarchaeota archaeon]